MLTHRRFHSQEYIEKVGKKLSKVLKGRCNYWLKNRKLTEEHKQKLKDGWQGKHHKKETKEKLRELQKIAWKMGKHNHQKGISHCNWKGDNVKMIALHNWIRRHKPKPEFCEYCKKVPAFDLANISGEYKRDINDFEWLCRSCHMIKDGRLDKLHENNRI